MRILIISTIASFILLLDQGSKGLVSKFIEPYSVINVFSGFNLVHSHNRGVSFGLFSSVTWYVPLLLGLVSLCIALAMGYWAFKTQNKIQRLGLSLIVGGALSNILDRVDNGAVTDFLDFYIYDYHWPAFNIADAGIVVGVAVIIFESFLQRDTIKERVRE